MLAPKSKAACDYTIALSKKQRQLHKALGIEVADSALEPSGDPRWFTHTPQDGLLLVLSATSAVDRRFAKSYLAQLPWEPCLRAPWLDDQTADWQTDGIALVFRIARRAQC